MVLIPDVRFPESLIRVYEIIRLPPLFVEGGRPKVIVVAVLLI